MLKPIKKYLREILSSKYLDIAELFPNLDYPRIARYRKIRQEQSKWAEVYLRNKTKPENSEIFLRELRLNVAFQPEEFELIRDIIKNIFPRDDQVEDFLSELKKNDSNLHGSEWSNIGLILKDSNVSTGRSMVVADLPEHVEYINVAYYKVMPSLASLSFTFYLEESFSEKLASIQKQKIVPIVVFNDLFPFFKSFPGYYMGWKGQNSPYNVQVNIYKYVMLLSSWLLKRYKLNKKADAGISLFQIFEVKGDELNVQSLDKCKISDIGWLEDYGISVRPFDYYKADNIICSGITSNELSWRSYALTFFNNYESNNAIQAGGLVDSLTVIESLNAFLDAIHDLVREHRIDGFSTVMTSDQKIFKKSKNINAVKQLVFMLKRLVYDIDENDYFISHSIKDLNRFNAAASGKKVNMGDMMFERTKDHVKTLQTIAGLIDDAMTEHLKMQNIYAMYGLQRWMFGLSIVITIATFVSVISNWESLVALFNKLEMWYKTK